MVNAQEEIITEDEGMTGKGRFDFKIGSWTEGTLKQRGE